MPDALGMQSLVKTINRTLRLTHVITVTQFEASPPEPSVDFLGTSETSENRLSLSQILKVRTSPNTLHNWYQFLNWIEELILISLPAFPQCFQSLKSETFGKQEAKRNIVLSLRNNDLKKAKSPEGCETHSTFFDSYRCTDWRRNSQKERNEKNKTKNRFKLIHNPKSLWRNQKSNTLKFESRQSPKKRIPKVASRLSGWNGVQSWLQDHWLDKQPTCQSTSKQNKT